ncbi:expressed protein [Phakopsora pachyrhizi]|uniref:Expressed protein n=1 Tax=Phakopsora pachyrhizi TaxID=170000 RepID=A0AAV0B7V5_PHAPC|nr:expressed protein [Phakopsora pachyrhizi]
MIGNTKVNVEEEKSNSSSSNRSTGPLSSSDSSSQSSRKRTVEKIYIKESKSLVDGEAQPVEDDTTKDCPIKGLDGSKKFGKISTSDETEQISEKIKISQDIREDEAEKVEMIKKPKEKPINFERFLMSNKNIFQRVISLLSYQDYRCLYNTINEPTRFILESNYYSFKSIILERYLSRFGYRSCISHNLIASLSQGVGKGRLKQKTQKFPEISLRDLDLIYFGVINFGF